MNSWYTTNQSMRKKINRGNQTKNKWTTTVNQDHNTNEREENESEIYLYRHLTNVLKDI